MFVNLHYVYFASPRLAGVKEESCGGDGEAVARVGGWPAGRYAGRAGVKAKVGAQEKATESHQSPKGKHRLRARHQSHQPPHPDPAGETRERTNLRFTNRTRTASKEGVRYAGLQALYLTDVFPRLHMWGGLQDKKPLTRKDFG